MKHYKDTDNNLFGFDDDQSVPDGLIEISLDEVKTIVDIKKQAAFNSLPYDKKRAAEYPPITDYIDGVVKGDQAQIDAYIAACQAVKAKYPKPV